ncbi:MAG: CHASE3 domain-containing protein [Methyloceanibacter sp.]|uniref:CHASE3 domain-containing protein n=1 Tax=Methyloceanibacter sp. TaxID=1965321 RepID=UPI003C70DB90
MMAVGFGLVVVAAIAVALMFARSREADKLVDHTFEVQSTAQTLLSQVQAAENGQRGFLITGDDDYLKRFDGALARVPELLASLRQQTADNPRQQARLDRLEPLVKARFDRIQSSIDLAKEGDRDAAFDVVKAGEGKTLMDDIVAELSAFVKAERDLLAMRQSRSAEIRLWLSLLTGMALVAATLLAVLLAIATRQAVSGLLERTRELEEESKLRREAEATLMQAQKMEAVGQLSGGIAHDFNNLLTIIIGNLDAMKRQLAMLAGLEPARDIAGKLSKSLDAALRGAQSSAQLTHRLLAFSRRQALEPQRLDLNRLVSGMLEMFRRTLGSDISIETVLGAGLWPTFADGHQLENVLLNLALNAKAAMPDGGCLTIETANTYLDDAYVRRFGDIKAGQYAVLCVTDTGTGIAKDILDKVFEPFFTTKPPGEGSGLGLAMVHGFVKQSGGHVRIYSEEGRGTTVKIYLPRLIGEEVGAVPAGKAEGKQAIPRAKPGEMILLVEDSEGVREYARDILLELGYGVIDAANVQEALRAVAKKPHISLLFTDVVLGESNGRVLADKVRQIYPNLPVLFTTGYTRNAIVHQGRLDPDVQLLNKPFTQQDLARKLRELLDGAATPEVAPAAS